MSRWLVVLLALFVLAGCGGAPEALVPTPAPPTCAQQATTFVAQIEPLAREWDDANTLANSTQRASLSAQIENLQAIRRKTENLQAPDCAAPAKQTLVSAMDATIRGYIAFLGQKSDNDVKPLLALAMHQTDTFKQDMQALKAGNPVPTPEPPLTDGLGVTQAAVQAVYQKDGFTFTDSPLEGGRSRSLGEPQNKLTSVELVGSAGNIQRAFMFATMISSGQDPLNRMKETLRTFLRTVAPDWTAGDAWLMSAMNAPGGAQTTVTRGRLVSYERIASAGGDGFSLIVQIP